MIEVEAKSRLVVKRVVDDARLAIDIPGGVVLRALRSAARAHVGLARQRVVTDERVFIVVGLSRDEIVRGDRPEGRHRFIDVGEGARAELARDAGDADVLAHRVARLPCLASLRRDDHHAVRRLRSVNRRGGRALQHLDRLDVARIEIGNTIRRIVFVAGDALPRRRERQKIRRRLDRRIADDDTIDDVERCRRSNDRRDAAQPNLHAAARRARVRRDLGAHHLALQRHSSPCAGAWMSWSAFTVATAFAALRRATLVA